MAIKYYWKFQEPEVLKDVDGMADVVKTIHWNRYAENDAGTVACAGGSVPLPLPDPATFKSFDILDEEWVIEAMQSVPGPGMLETVTAEDGTKTTKMVPAPFVNVAVIDAYLAEEIARIENPPTKRVDFSFVKAAKAAEAATKAAESVAAAPVAA